MIKIRVNRIFNVIKAIIILAIFYYLCWRLVEYRESSELVIGYRCTTSWRCGGWGDRLKGIMSTYALSLVLNRSFSIEITQPCPLESMLLPNKVNWVSNYSRWINYLYEPGYNSE